MMWNSRHPDLVSGKATSVNSFQRSTLEHSRGGVDRIQDRSRGGNPGTSLACTLQDDTSVNKTKT